MNVYQHALTRVRQENSPSKQGVQGMQLWSCIEGAMHIVGMMHVWILLAYVVYATFLWCMLPIKNCHLIFIWSGVLLRAAACASYPCLLRLLVRHGLCLLVAF